MGNGIYYTFKETRPFDSALSNDGRSERVKAKSYNSALKQLSKNQMGSRWVLINSTGSELDVYGMTDQPTTCPRCGSRTEFDEIPDTNPLRETHICNNPVCKFQFIAEDGD